MARAASARPGRVVTGGAAHVSLVGDGRHMGRLRTRRETHAVEKTTSRLSQLTGKIAGLVVPW